MGSGHRHVDSNRLLVHRDTPVHRLPPEVKLVALVVFVTASALTPRHAVWAFAVHATILTCIGAISRVPPVVIARRLLVVGPFLVAAALVPIIGDGPRTAVGPFELSTDGLWAAWNIAAKAVLGATASILLTSTTSIPDLLTGMTRLRVPRPMVSIVAFMVRYLDLIAAQLHRMHLAMVARAHDPRWLWQARPAAHAAGTLFVRTYERGERIHHAMVARGFTGHMPDLDRTAHGPAARTVRTAWLTALTPAAVASVAAVVAIVR